MDFTLRSPLGLVVLYLSPFFVAAILDALEIRFDSRSRRMPEWIAHALYVIFLFAAYICSFIAACAGLERLYFIAFRDRASESATVFGGLVASWLPLLPIAAGHIAGFRLSALLFRDRFIHHTLFQYFMAQRDAIISDEKGLKHDAAEHRKRSDKIYGRISKFDAIMASNWSFYRSCLLNDLTRHRENLAKKSYAIHLANSSRISPVTGFECQAIDDEIRIIDRQLSAIAGEIENERNKKNTV